MESDNPKVTISFTADLYVAAILMAVYDVLAQKHSDLSHVSPFTPDSFPAVLDEMHIAAEKLLEYSKHYPEHITNGIQRALGV